MLDFTDPFELLQNALLEYKSENFEEVIHILENGASLADESPLYFILLSKAYLKVGDYPKSSFVVQSGLEKFPFNKSLLHVENDIKSLSTLLADRSENFQSENLDRVNDIFFHLDFDILKVLKFRKIPF